MVVIKAIKANSWRERSKTLDLKMNLSKFKFLVNHLPQDTHPNVLKLLTVAAGNPVLNYRGLEKERKKNRAWVIQVGPSRSQSNMMEALIR